MDEGARRWLFKTVRKNYWRVSSWYDVPDLIQEGYEVYYEVVNERYPNAVDPPHRMRLFQLAFLSRIHDLANQRTRAAIEIREAELSRTSDNGAVSSVFDTFVDESSLLEVLPALAAAPQYVKDALALFATEDGLRKVRAQYRKVRVGKHLMRETLNERLCRLTRNDPRTTDIVKGIRDCLAEA